jgi:hypothetical protein
VSHPLDLLGQAAYSAYRVMTGGRSLVTRSELPVWEELTEEVRTAWRGTADGVRMFLTGTTETLRVEVSAINGLQLARGQAPPHYEPTEAGAACSVILTVPDEVRRLAARDGLPAELRVDITRVGGGVLPG